MHVPIALELGDKHYSLEQLPAQLPLFKMHYLEAMMFNHGVFTWTCYYPPFQDDSTYN